MSARNCLACVHCRWTGGQNTGYCSSCAGHDEAQLVCDKGHWDIGGMDEYTVNRLGKKGLVDHLDEAVDCADFEAEAWAPKQEEPR